MTEEELEAYKTYPRSKLIAFVTSDKPTSDRHLAAKLELERRAGGFSRRIAVAAFIVSVLSLSVAVTALWRSWRSSASTASPPAVRTTP